MKLMAIIEDLNKLKNEKNRELKAAVGLEANSQQQKLRVCNTCSAYLSIFDSDKRLADHFAGKVVYHLVEFISGTLVNVDLRCI